MRLGCALLIVGSWVAVGCSDSDDGPSDNTAGAGPTGVEDLPDSGGGAGGHADIDDPFGVGPRYCDQNSGVGGDACGGAWGGVGFFPEPEHMTTALEDDAVIVMAVKTEYTPTTALKVAVESGVHMKTFGSDAEVDLTKTWSPRGDDNVAITLRPNEALAPGWYSLFVPRAAREVLGASYTRYVENPMFIGGPFVELDSGDLRADFRVGSRPLVARIWASPNSLLIAFSESVEADPPPVSLAIGDYEPECAPSEWSGAGRTLTLACTTLLQGYGDPITVSIGAGFVAASGEPLRSVDGAMAFEIDVPENGSVQLDASDVSE